MSILDKLEFLMAQKGIKNKKQLSELSKIPYTTIVGLYTKGFEKMKLSTLKSLASFFDVSIDYLVYDNVATPNKQVSDRETELLTKFRELNINGQDKVFEYIEDLAENSKYKKCYQPELVQEA